MKLSIGSIIVDYDGTPIVDQQGPLTIRRLLRMYAGSYVPSEQSSNAAEDSVVASAIGLKIHNSEEEVELTDEEVEVLKKTISTPRHAAVIYSQVRDIVFKNVVKDES